MQVTEPTAAPLALDPKRETRQGKRISKLMLEGKEGSFDNYSVQLEDTQVEVKHPRHKHNFEQFRYPIKGEFVYAKDKVLPTGWVGYFPAGAYYGPESRYPGTLLLVVQCGGASRDMFLTKRQRYEAYDALVTKGQFDLEKGVYTFVDKDGQRHNQDAYEAIWQQAMGREVSYPEPRYNDIIIMNPATYHWIAEPGSPGVARKTLGSFTECGSSAGFIRLDAGATLKAGMHDAPELLFLTKGTVKHAGRSYGVHTSFGFEPGEGPIDITAVEPSEFLCIHVPKVAAIVQ